MSKASRRMQQRWEREQDPFFKKKPPPKPQEEPERWCPGSGCGIGPYPMCDA